MFQSKPDLLYLRSFGCTCFPLLIPYNKHKLQPHTKHCIFLGYLTHSKGYICLEPSTHRIYISRHVLFNETEFLLSPSTLDPSSHTTLSFNSCSISHWLAFLSNLPTSPSPTVNSVPTPSTSVSVSTPASLPSPHITDQSTSSVPASLPDPTSVPLVFPIHPTPNSDESIPSMIVPVPTSVTTQKVHPMTTRSKAGVFKPKAFSASSSKKAQIDYTVTKPPSFKVAAQHQQWCNVMNEEFDSLTRQATWVLVPPSPS